MKWKKDATESWQAARVRLRREMSKFVDRQKGRTHGQRIEAASDALCPDSFGNAWKVRNVRKAIEPGFDNWLPRVEALVIFCEVADVSLNDLLYGTGEKAPFATQLGEFVLNELVARGHGAREDFALVLPSMDVFGQRLIDHCVTAAAQKGKLMNRYYELTANAIVAVEKQTGKRVKDPEAIVLDVSRRGADLGILAPDEL